MYEAFLRPEKIHQIENCPLTKEYDRFQLCHPKYYYYRGQCYKVLSNLVAFSELNSNAQQSQVNHVTLRWLFIPTTEALISLHSLELQMDFWTCGLVSIIVLQVTGSPAEVNIMLSQLDGMELAH